LDVWIYLICFFFSSRRRHTRFSRDWSSDVCSSDLESASIEALRLFAEIGVPLPGDEGGQAAEVRRIQEREAVRLACRRHRPEDVEALRRCLAEWEGALGDAAQLAELDRVFHCGIVRATQNTVLLRLVNVFYLMTRERRTVYFG